MTAPAHEFRRDQAWRIVLAGWLGGLWAQQPAMPAHRIACAGVDAHGRAGEVDAVLRAGDLIGRLATLR